MIAIIDGDSFPYSLSYRCQRDNWDETFALEILDSTIAYIMNRSGCTQYIGILGKSSFRKEVTTTYKEGRKYDLVETSHFQLILNTLIKKYRFYTVTGLEADDVCFTLHQGIKDSVLCSGDKDLQQSEGKHYNYRTDIRFKVNEFEARYYLCKQLLMGDSGDNICGIPGIGPSKATKILMDRSKDMMDLVYDTYMKHYGISAQKKFIESVILLKLVNKEQLISKFKPVGYYDEIPIRNEEQNILLPVHPFHLL